MHIRYKDTHRLRANRWKKDTPYKDEKAWGAILVTNQIDFKTKSITRNKEGLNFRIKRSFHQEDTKRVIPDGSALKYMLEND